MLSASFDKLSSGLKEVSYPDQRPLSQLSITIVFCSSSGTCQGFAQSLWEDLVDENIGAQATLKSGSDIAQIDEVIVQTHLVIISSTIDGQIPENSANFMSELMDEKNTCSLKYAVFGSGDASYQHYNAAAKAIDQRFREIGGERIVELGLGDEADGSADSAFERWKNGLIRTLMAEFGHTPQQIVDKYTAMVCSAIETLPVIDFQHVLALDKPWLTSRENSIKNAWKIMGMQQSEINYLPIPAEIPLLNPFSIEIDSPKLGRRYAQINAQHVLDAIKKRLGHMAVPSTFSEAVSLWLKLYLFAWIEFPVSPGRLGLVFTPYLSTMSNEAMKILIQELDSGPSGQVITLSLDGQEGVFAEFFISVFKTMQTTNLHLAILLSSPPRAPTSLMWTCLELAADHHVNWVNEHMAQTLFKYAGVEFQRDMLVMLTDARSGLRGCSSLFLCEQDEQADIAREAMAIDGLMPLVPMVWCRNHANIPSSIQYVTCDKSDMLASRHAIADAGVCGSEHPPLSSACSVMLPPSDSPTRRCGDILSLIREQYIAGVVSLCVRPGTITIPVVRHAPATAPVKRHATEFSLLVEKLL